MIYFSLGRLRQGYFFRIASKKEIWSKPCPKLRVFGQISWCSFHSVFSCFLRTIIRVDIANHVPGKQEEERCLLCYCKKQEMRLMRNRILIGFSFIPFSGIQELKKHLIKTSTCSVLGYGKIFHGLACPGDFSQYINEQVPEFSDAVDFQSFIR